MTTACCDDGLAEYNNERIHEIGAIQDQGYLIAVRLSENPAGDDEVIAISANLLTVPWMQSFVSISTAEDILHKKLSDVFEANVAQLLKHLIQRFQTITCNSEAISTARNFTLLQLLCRGQQVKVAEQLVCVSVVGCRDRGTFLLELEEVTDLTVVIPNSRILQSGDIVGRIRAANSILSVTSTYLDAIMEIIPGYDRGMVYRFGEDFSGEVIYEKIKNPEVVKSSYLNLRFPPEDIPAPARQLYIKTGVRYICDVNGVDSPILSMGNAPIDLTMTSLRACSKCHIQYLQNMGIVGSLSIAIVVEEQLWGLYTLHSYTKPAKPSAEERIMLEMSGSITAMRISAFMREESAHRKIKLNELMVVLQSMSSVREFLLSYNKELLQTMDAHALVLYDENDGKLVFGDNTIIPTPEGYEKLKRWRTGALLVNSSFTEGLMGLGAGIVFYKHQHCRIAIIRKSKVSDVRWGGNPDVVRDDNIPGRLRPRSSFDLYVERGRTECRNWTPTDCELTQFFFDRIVHYLHAEMLSSFRLSLDQSNAECVQAIQSVKEHYEFFAHMSHELRTPFHGVMSSLQILDSGGSNISEEERKDIIGSALECGKTMLRTLDDILTIAKAKNCVEIVKSPLILSKISSTCWRMMVPIAEHKGITFRLETRKIKVGNQVLAEDAFRQLLVTADETRLGQIANNLANNALKFTPPGGTVVLRVSVAANLKEVWDYWGDVRSKYEGHVLTIDQVDNLSVANTVKTDDIWYIHEVVDDGCGVKEDDLRSMFDAYKQVSSGVSKIYQGTGLGLHIVRLHIELMGGVLGVASTHGKGTVFMCAVPMTMKDAAHESSDDPKIAVDVNNAASSTNATTSAVNAPEVEVLKEVVDVKDAIFMVVDDSSVNLRLTKRKLQLTLGNELLVKTAVDGIEAIEMYEDLIKTGKQSQLRGIFMDYHMPRCSGKEAIMEIRRLEAMHTASMQPCYIIAFTADLSETSSRELINAGANEVLAKPTPAGQLESIAVKLMTK